MTTTSWKAGNGNWITAANWTAGVPNATLDADIVGTSSAPILVAFAAGTATAHSLYMQYATLDISGGHMTFLHDSSYYGIAETAGTLEVQGGGYVESVFSLTGGTVEIDGSTLDLLDGGTIGGTVEGTGTLELGSGGFTLGTGADLAMNALDVGSATLTLDGNLTDTHVFDESTGGTILLNAKTLELSGPSALHGVIGGAGRIIANQLLALDNMTLGGSAVMLNYGTATSAEGFTIGDSSTSSANVTNEHGATIDLTNDFYIYANGTAKIVNAGLFEKTGGFNTTYVRTAFSSTGTIAVATGTLDFTGAASYAGTVEGAGTLQLGGSAARTIDAGIRISTTGLDIGDGTGGTVTLAGNLSYAGLFDEYYNTVLVLNKDTLTLSGTDDFGGSVDGTGLVIASGLIDTEGMTLGGAATLEITGTALQTDSNAYVGDAAGSTALLEIGAKGTYELSHSTAIGASGSGQITNAGLLEADAGTGVISYVAPFVTSTATVDVVSGTLYFDGGAALSGTLEGAGTLALGNAGTDTIAAGTSVGVAGLELTASSGTVTLNESLAYAGAFTMQNGSRLALGAQTLTLSGPSLLDGAIFGSGRVVLSGPASLDYASFGGTLTVENAGTATQGEYIYLGTTTTDAVTLLNNAGATYTILGAQSIYTYSTATLDNLGLLDKRGLGAAAVAAAIVNSGTIEIRNGELAFSAGGTLGGTIAGAGTIGFTGGTVTLDSGLALTAADMVISYATVVLETNLTYAGVLLDDSGGVIALGTDTLTVSGPDVLAGSITGSGTLDVTGTSSLNDFVIGGNAVLLDAGTIVENGYLEIGNTASSTAELSIAAGHAYDIVTDLEISSDGTASIANAGLFEKTGGLNTTTITPAFTNTGTLAEQSGTLDFLGGFTNSGTIVTSAGTLYLGGSLTGTGQMQLSNGAQIEIVAATPAGQTIDFKDALDTLKLDVGGSFAGAITGMAAGDLIDLANIGTITNLAYSTATDDLVAKNGTAVVASLKLLGSYTSASFTHFADSGSGTYISVT